MKDEEKYLEDEMVKFGERWPYPASFDGYDKDWVDELAEECAKHFYELGKKAMKEQMLKDAVEGEIQMRYSGCLCAKTIRAINEDKFKLGDKVRIIILKAEEE